MKLWFARDWQIRFSRNPQYEGGTSYDGQGPQYMWWGSVGVNYHICIIKYLSPKLFIPHYTFYALYDYFYNEKAKHLHFLLIVQAEECEKTQSDTVETEKRVLEEFGVCLAQIIEASSRSRKPPLSQWSILKLYKID